MSSSGLPSPSSIEASPPVAAAPGVALRQHVLEQATAAELPEQAPERLEAGGL